MTTEDEIAALVRIKRIELLKELQAWATTLPTLEGEHPTLRFTLEVEFGPSVVDVSVATQNNEQMMLGDFLRAEMFIAAGVEQKIATRTARWIREHIFETHTWSRSKVPEFSEKDLVADFVLKKTKRAVLRIPNIGDTSADALDDTLAYYGFNRLSKT